MAWEPTGLGNAQRGGWAGERQAGYDLAAITLQRLGTRRARLMGSLVTGGGEGLSNNDDYVLSADSALYIFFIFYRFLFM